MSGAGIHRAGGGWTSWTSWTSWTRRLGAACVLGLLGCEEPPDALAAVREAGAIRIAVLAVDPRAVVSPDRLERALAQRFAGSLGVELELVERATPAGLLEAVRRGEADLAAGPLPVPPPPRPDLRIGRHYRLVDEVLVTRRDTRLGTPVALAGAPVGEALRGLDGAAVEVKEAAGQTSLALLREVWLERLPAATATSDELASFRGLFPELRSAQVLRAKRPLAWVFPRAGGTRLYRASIHFFNRLEREGELERLAARYLDHLRAFDYVATRRFLRHIERRLPRYEPLFRRSARRHGLDWRLLAAIGHQESHWNPRAVSATGVKGLMMLTEATAEELGVDREDPAESIQGAARYLTHLLERLPPEILPEERVAFALAAYNVGLGHVEDARELARRAGADPDRWHDVAAYLARLRESLWYAQTRHGQARGHEAVAFVRAVRRRHELLAWHRPAE